MSTPREKFEAVLNAYRELQEVMEAVGPLCIFQRGKWFVAEVVRSGDRSGVRIFEANMAVEFETMSGKQENP